MSTDKKNNVMSMKFPPEIKMEIQKIAEEEVRSLNNTINMLVIKGIEARKQSQ